MTFVTPCARPENDPDDWFIERDGRQYPDDDFAGLERADELTAALIRRRQARDKCHTECIFRLHCLGRSEAEDNGTWGGYFVEERRQIWKLRDERAAERAALGVG